MYCIICDVCMYVCTHKQLLSSVGECVSLIYVLALADKLLILSSCIPIPYVCMYVLYVCMGEVYGIAISRSVA